VVAHTCNPSYLEGRDQEDQGLKPALANIMSPYLENTQHKKIKKKKKKGLKV
jgi:hypothetical protein